MTDAGLPAEPTLTDEPDLEDLAVRPHSAASVIRTFIGLHLRRLGGWIAVADLVELCGQAGSSDGGTRSALSRLKGRGLLVAETVDGRPGYRLAPAATAMLARGDRRIYTHYPMRPDEGWLVAVFTVPDAERSLRHRIRQQLVWLGCGMITPGTWIGPGHLLDEATTVLSQQGLRDYVTFLHAYDPQPPVPLREAVARWWDLDDLNHRYRTFLTEHVDTKREWDGTDRQAFTEHLRLVDDWRAIPYLDPGLPAELTGPDWLGHDGMELFGELHAMLGGPAARHVDAVVLG